MHGDSDGGEMYVRKDVVLHGKQAYSFQVQLPELAQLLYLTFMQNFTVSKTSWPMSSRVFSRSTF